MNHGPVVFGSAAARFAPPSAAGEAFRQQLVAHPVESYFKVFHAGRVDNGIEKRFQNDQTVDGDADGQSHNRIETLERHDAILAVNDEPNHGRHPAQDERPDNEQSSDDGLSFVFNVYY